MTHVSFLFYIISLITGTVSIGISSVIYSQYKKPVIRLYMLFLAAFTMILAELCIRKYLVIVELAHPGVSLTIVSALDFAAVNLLIITAPFFFHNLLTLTIPPIARTAFFILPGVSIALSLIRYTVPAWDLPIRIAGIIILFGVMLYGIVLVIARFHTIGNKTLKKAMGVFIFLNIIFAPIMAIEIFRPEIPWLKDFDLFEMFSVPAYFFSITFLSILFALRYFNQPPYLKENNLTSHFLNRFGITGREKEIISLLIKGESYNEIGEQLYISYKTVDNHVRNIYQKTEVKNKLQLLNLIRSNQLQ